MAVVVNCVTDRVEVRWMKGLYSAEVTKLHTSGKVDMAYEMNNTAAKEHAEGGAVGTARAGGGKKKVCSAADCSNSVAARSLCAHHRRKTCLVEGCTIKAQARGMCNKHGSNGKCVKPDCIGNAYKRGGHCKKHEPKLAYPAPGCYTPQVLGNFVCATYGAFGNCTVYACLRNAIASGRGKDGVCTHHSAKVKCSSLSCRSNAVLKGLCTKHGAHGICFTEGCDDGVYARGLCKPHGGNGFCSWGLLQERCTTAASVRGRCGKHVHTKKECKVEGCNTAVIKRGLCGKHGAHGTCKFDGCATNASSGSTHCWTHGGGGRKQSCSVVDCSTTSKCKGLCAKHGGGKAQCWISGCTNQMVSRLKTCKSHGGLGYCTLAECWTPALKFNGNCRKHTK